MKKCSITIFCVVLITTISGQNNRIDSIENVIKNYTKRDSFYVVMSHAYSKIAFMHNSSFYEKNTLEAIEVAKKIKEHKFLVDLLGNLAGHYNYIKKDNVRAIELFIETAKSLKYLEEAKVPREIILIAERGIYNNIANIYFSIGDYNNTEIYLNKFIDNNDSLVNKRGYIRMLSNYYLTKGELCFKKKNFLTGAENLHKAVKYGIETNVMNTVAVSYTSLIIYYNEINKPDSAKFYGNKALYLIRQLKMNEALPYLYGNIATTYYKTGNDSLAIKYAKYGMDTAKLIGDIAAEIEIRKTLIKVYERQKKFEEAYYEFDNFYALKDSINAQEQKLQIQRKEVEYFANRKADSLKYQIQQTKLLQEKLNIENAKKLALIELAFSKEKNNRLTNEYKSNLLIRETALKLEQEKNQKQQIHFIATQNALKAKSEIIETTNQRNYILLGSSLLIIGLGTIFWNYNRRKKVEEQQKDLITKAAFAENEMKVLRLQLNPHFIFNSLNSIADYIQKNNPDKADYYLSKFAKLMRGTLESSEVKAITLAEELEIIEQYTQLEKMRLQQKLNVVINNENNINFSDVIVPPLILQPFIENSIWHGIAPKENGGTITINIKKNNANAVIEIIDDGVGRNANIKTSNTKKSYGVGISKERIDLFNQLNQTNASVQYEDVAVGTKVILTFPFSR
jgi:tetratricopeptide (TPR) repeat protein